MKIVTPKLPLRSFCFNAVALKKKDVLTEPWASRL